MTAHIVSYGDVDPQATIPSKAGRKRPGLHIGGPEGRGTIRFLQPDLGFTSRRPRGDTVV